MAEAPEEIMPARGTAVRPSLATRTGIPVYRPAAATRTLGVNVAAVRNHPFDAMVIGRVRPQPAAAVGRAAPNPVRAPAVPMIRVHGAKSPPRQLHRGDQGDRLQNVHHQLPEKVHPTTPPGLKPGNWSNAGSYNSPVINITLHPGASMSMDGATICMSPNRSSPSSSTPQTPAKLDVGMSEAEKQHGSPGGGGCDASARTTRGPQVGDNWTTGSIDKNGAITLHIEIRDVAEIKKTLDVILAKVKKAEDDCQMGGTMLGVWHTTGSKTVMVTFNDMDVAKIAQFSLVRRSDVENKNIASVTLTNAATPEGALRLHTPFVDSKNE